MTTNNTIKTAGKVFKSGLLGLVAAAGMGLMTLPAHADEIKQDNVQTNVQEGYDNTGVNQSTQNAEIRETQKRIGRTGHDVRGEKDVINQNSDQLNDQVGEGNTGVNQNNQDASVRKDRRVIGH